MAVIRNEICLNTFKSLNRKVEIFRIIVIFASKYRALLDMDIAKAFEVAFNRKIEKNWEKIYVVVDIHDTILRACYENE